MVWEVLNGVGVDGVGVIFPFFYAFLLFFYAFSPLLLKEKGKQKQFTAKMGNFTPTPSAPTPCKTSRMVMRLRRMVTVLPKRGVCKRG